MSRPARRGECHSVPNDEGLRCEYPGCEKIPPHRSRQRTPAVICSKKHYHALRRMLDHGDGD